MKISNLFVSCLFLVFSLAGCQKDKSLEGNDLLATDLLFEEIKMDRFSHKIPTEPFKSKIATFNVKHNGTDWSGFAISNRNNRNFVKEETHLDSVRFSVYTGTVVHAGGNYLVAKPNDDQSFITFDRAVQVDRVLVANTTQVWQTITYGPGNATVGSTFSLGTRILSAAKKDYAKVIAIGYLNNQPTGEVTFLLADRQSDDLKRTFTITDWMPMDLSELGKIDKLLFKFETTDVTGGIMNTPSYFCLDGFRFKEKI